jgi:subtilisin family serine protease
MPTSRPACSPGPPGESWNFVYPAAGNTTDPDGHGTHVCGTAAAAENGGGMVGLAPGCRLMPLQVELMGSTADYQRRADAINFVAQAARTNPGKRYVLNMSWKTAGDVTSIRKAIAGAIETGVVVVAAAGNDDSDMDKNSHYPASYPGLIAVAALDFQRPAGQLFQLRLARRHRGAGRRHLFDRARPILCLSAGDLDGGPRM